MSPVVEVPPGHRTLIEADITVSPEKHHNVLQWFIRADSKNATNILRALVIANPYTPMMIYDEGSGELNENEEPVSQVRMKTDKTHVLDEVVDNPIAP